MSTNNYPALPEPQGATWQYDQHGHGRYEPNDCFTADQMHAYFDLARATQAGVSDEQMSRACLKAWDASSYSGECDAVHPMFAFAFEAGAQAVLAQTEQPEQAPMRAQIEREMAQAEQPAPTGTPLTDEQRAWLPFARGLLRQAGELPGEDAELEDGWQQAGAMLYRLTDEHRPQNRDEITVTMSDSSRTPEACARRAGELLDTIRAARKSKGGE